MRGEGRTGKLADRGNIEGATSASDAASLGGFVCFAIVVAWGLLVVAYAAGVGFPSLHILGLEETLNDQVVYVNAARRWLVTGDLSTGLIYPSTLEQVYARNYFYMPGHAFLLAVSLATFGDSAFGTMLPNLAAYAVCLTSLSSITRRLLGARAARIAAVCFMLTPIFLAYAFSAMAEMTTLAGGLAALAIFVRLPTAARPWAAPLLLVVPFLFRETAAFWLAPMLVVIWTDANRERVARLGACAIASLGSVLVLTAVYRLPWIADRPSLFVQNLLGRDYADKYTDALFLSGVEPDAATIASAMLDLTVRNLGELVEMATTPSFEALTFHLLFWPPLVAAGLGWRFVRLRPLVLAWGSLFVLGFAFTTSLYRWNDFIGVRQLLPSVMLGWVVVGGVLAERSRSWSPRTMLFGGLLAWIVSGGLLIAQVRAVIEYDDWTTELRGVLARVPMPERGVFVGHHSLCVVWLHDHPHALVSFSPANAGTLELLDERYDVRVAVLQMGEISRLSRVGLLSAGLRDAGPLSIFRVFWEPPPGEARRGPRRDFAPQR